MQFYPPMISWRSLGYLSVSLILLAFLFSGCSKSGALQSKDGSAKLSGEQPNIAPLTTDPNVTPTVPAAPSQLTAALENVSSVRINWVAGSADGQADFTSFQIERRVAGTSQISYFSQDRSSRSYLDTNLNGSTTYEYRVRASNERGISEPSNMVSLSTPPSSGTCTLAVPTGVSVAIAGASIQVTWTDNNCDEEGYVIQRATGAGAFTDLVIKPANSASHVDDTTNVNVAYSYKIKAFKGAFSSDYSSVVSLTIPGTPPASPANLIARLGSSNPLTLDLSWQDLSSNETSFIVERKTGTGSFVEVGRVGVGIVSFFDSFVVEGNEYQYRILATNSFGNSPASNIATVNIPSSPQLPSVPQLSGALSTVSPATQIELSWSMSDPNVTNFQLEQKTLGATDYTQVGNLDGNVRVFSALGLSASTQYSFRIRASNAVGFSGYSQVITLTTGPSAFVLAPSNFLSTAIQPRRISLAWVGSPSPISGYEIQRRELSQNQFSSIYSVSNLPSASRSIDDTGVVPSTSYVYQIRAVNLSSGQVSSWVESTTITTPADNSGGTGPITLLTPANLQAVPSRTTITLNWQDTNSQRDGFQILRNDGANEIIIGTSVSLNYVDSAVVTDRSYRYRVRAFRLVSGVTHYSEFSAEAVTQLLPPPLPAPQFLTAIAFSAAQVNLSWAAIGMSDVKYRVLRSNNLGLSFNLLTEVPGLSFQDTTAIPQTTYHYEIIAVKNDASAVSAASNILVVTTPAAVCTDCPAAPYDFRAAWSTSRNITVKWKYHRPNPDKFMLYQSQDNQSFEPVDAAGLKKTKRRYVFKHLDPSKTYYFRIAALRDGKLSQYAVTLMTGDVSKPAIPTQVTAILNPGTRSISLSFVGSINTDEFEIFRQRKFHGWVEIKGDLLPDDESQDGVETYVDTPPLSNKEYRYKVRARNSTGRSAFSVETPYLLVP